jgi:hypothetical protein
MLPSLDIIIVNWNSGGQLGECLASIARCQRDSFQLDRVVVVDNASADGSADIEDTKGLPLVLLRNSVNRGFAAACNQGAKGSSADFLLFLNPDTVLEPGSLAGPVGYLDSKDGKQAGIVGIQLVNEGGEVMRTCARFPTPWRFLTGAVGLDRLCPGWFPGHFLTEFDHRSARAVEQVMGAYFLMRRSLFEQLGGFDERFFVYFEEVDFAMRAHIAGWPSMYMAEWRAMHHGGGTTRAIPAARLFYSLRSRLLFARKHFSSGEALFVLFVTLLVEPVTRAAYALARLSLGETGATIRAYYKLWRALPRIIAERR